MILFPDHWANKNIALPVVPTPVGARCPECKELLEEGERGVWIPHLDGEGTQRAWHRECVLVNLLGSTVQCHACLDTGKVWVAADNFLPCVCKRGDWGDRR